MSQITFFSIHDTESNHNKHWITNFFSSNTPEWWPSCTDSRMNECVASHTQCLSHEYKADTRLCKRPKGIQDGAERAERPRFLSSALIFHN